MGRLAISYHAFANQFRRYYGSVGPIYSVFNLSIDASKPQRLNAKSNLYLDQHLIGSNNSLGPGRHTITLTHDAPIPAWNFFQSVICGAVKVKYRTLPISHCFPLLSYGVLAREGTSTLLSSFSTHGIWSATNGCTTSRSNQQKSNERCPTSSRLTLFLLALVIAVLSTYTAAEGGRRFSSTHTPFLHTAPLREDKPTSNQSYCTSASAPLNPFDCLAPLWSRVTRICLRAYVG